MLLVGRLESWKLLTDSMDFGLTCLFIGECRELTERMCMAKEKGKALSSGISQDTIRYVKSNLYIVLS